jgi:triosephosphate isomerase
MINLRLKASQRNGLIPILCVGETQEKHDAGETENFLSHQLQKALLDVNTDNLIIAYEAVWAIGTGKTCQPFQANQVLGFIRKQLYNKTLPLLYGGSVQASNIDEIMAQSEIDGVMVGKASLESANFARIVNYK